MPHTMAEQDNGGVIDSGDREKNQVARAKREANGNKIRNSQESCVFDLAKQTMEIHLK